MSDKNRRYVLKREGTHYVIWDEYLYITTFTGNLEECIDFLFKFKHKSSVRL